ncbi:hypothetical protein ACYFX5_12815 [Bremerella sp. T1]|uniref:hypothetical protein n=1 Tax=Bremerella sp. TYQ1 TaxID=3119568 RepID=UPI001CCE16D4|nr:hypothetical protein [Bremerella volcania]UBM33942.1 hypothetical protein LA756_14760 [Bremerella volcania]
MPSEEGVGCDKQAVIDAFHEIACLEITSQRHALSEWYKFANEKCGELKSIWLIIYQTASGRLDAEHRIRESDSVVQWVSNVNIQVNVMAEDNSVNVNTGGGDATNIFGANSQFSNTQIQALKQIQESSNIDPELVSQFKEAIGALNAEDELDEIEKDYAVKQLGKLRDELDKPKDEVDASSVKVAWGKVWGAVEGTAKAAIAIHAIAQMVSAFYGIPLF